MKDDCRTRDGAPSTPPGAGRDLLWQWLRLFFAPERRAWRGEAPLPLVFWGYGVIASACLAGLYAAAVFGQRLVQQQVLLIVFAAYTAWILVAVWRCAARADPFWGVPARWLTVAWAGNTALVLLFLQLDLLIRLMKG
jgi:hypothetical protein